MWAELRSPTPVIAGIRDQGPGMSGSGKALCKYHIRNGCARYNPICKQQAQNPAIS
jgi:hypothetical protein